jgi:hypothetical protein
MQKDKLTISGRIALSLRPPMWGLILTISTVSEKQTASRVICDPQSVLSHIALMD